MSDIGKHMFESLEHVPKRNKLNVRLRHRWLKTLYCSVLAGPEDYRALGMSARIPTHDPSWVPTPSYAQDKELEMDEGPIVLGNKGWPAVVARYFPQGDTGTGEIIQVTITTAYEALARRPRPWEKALMEANIGHPQWSVAAMILGLNSMPPCLLSALVDAQWHLTPLRDWKQRYGDFVEAVKRIGRTGGASPCEATDWICIRKVFNCCDRRLDEADWDTEYTRRTTQLPVQVGLREDGLVSSQRWDEMFNATITELADTIVRNMHAGPTLHTVQEWWDARWAHAPTGASTLRVAVRDVKQADRRLDSEARAGKKCTWESLPARTPAMLMTLCPPQADVRVSTKPEPGRKARALYATDDLNTVVSSFASVHMEKFMNVWGIKAKQTPSDVVEWIRAARKATGTAMWLSIDYSDFNHEHMLKTLVAFNLALAVAWKRYAAAPVDHQKAMAALWVALSHMNTMCNTEGKAEYRMVGTMCSGHRDTARDNSALHGAYARTAARMMVPLGLDVQPIEQFFTGDDEDALCRDTVRALLYYMGVTVAGFSLNPTKQNAGENTHEFLQRNAIGDGLPKRPLFAVLAQLASGNWYQDVHVWYDAAVGAVSDNAWELAARGMPLGIAQRLACSVINSTMRVPRPEGGYRKLEWWAYRHGSSVHPLWYGLAGKLKPAIDIAAKPRPHRIAPRRATASWVGSRMKMCRLRIKAEEKAELIDYCSRESYASLYRKERAAVHREYALTEWPERYQDPDYANMGTLWVGKPDEKALLRTLPEAECERRPATIDEVLSRFGIDQKMLDAVGGIGKMLANMPPYMVGKYENPRAPRLLPLEMRYLDGAIVSWLGNARGIELPMQQDRKTQAAARSAKLVWQRALVMQETKIMPSLVKVVMAPNGAGKTTYKRAAESGSCGIRSVLDMDDVLRTSGMQDAIEYWQVGNMPPTLKSRYAAHMQGKMELEEAQEVLVQWDLRDWLPKPVDRPYVVEVQILLPNWAELRDRLLKRGWPEAKIERRRNRWEMMADRMREDPTAAGVLSADEARNIKWIKTLETQKR
uniref:RNA-directed RNA polymerase n=1 Tax=Bolbocoleon piliferum toti-like virus TaxID=2933139 RepID=A0A9C7GX64_9VIRU|nr:RNA-dependent RNA polymerase [Bolbocoleon piliferum toti-like virus]CAI5383831.1 RNA-dependent RNA polymerase [Bolbocoleon piliferum toti-like virus]